jgi:hypothetical protein
VFRAIHDRDVPDNGEGHVPLPLWAAEAMLEVVVVAMSAPKRALTPATRQLIGHRSSNFLSWYSKRRREQLFCRLASYYRAPIFAVMGATVDGRRKLYLEVLNQIAQHPEGAKYWSPSYASIKHAVESFGTRKPSPAEEMDGPAEYLSPWLVMPGEPSGSLFFDREQIERLILERDARTVARAEQRRHAARRPRRRDG